MMRRSNRGSPTLVLRRSTYSRVRPTCRRARRMSVRRRLSQFRPALPVSRRLRTPSTFRRRRSSSPVRSPLWTSSRGRSSASTRRRVPAKSRVRPCRSGQRRLTKSSATSHGEAGAHICGLRTHQRLRTPAAAAEGLSSAWLMRCLRRPKRQALAPMWQIGHTTGQSRPLRKRVAVAAQLQDLDVGVVGGTSHPFPCTFGSTGGECGEGRDSLALVAP
jgi:hypothetical protein